MTSGVIHPCNKRQREYNGNECEPEFEFEFSSNLPDQILVEILIRVPAKSCCRYKAVCKRWNSLISSSFFISRFINHHRLLNNHQAAPYSFTLVLPYDCSGRNFSWYFYRLEAFSPNSVSPKSYLKQRVDTSFLPRFGHVDKHQPIYIEASCQDLFVCSYFNYYYVVNLLTRQWIVLPCRPSCFGILHNGNRIPVSTCDPKVGLLCCHDWNDINNGDGWYKFKVILVPIICVTRFSKFIPNDVHPGTYTTHLSIYIFCSESRQWTEFLVDWYPLRLTAFLHASIIAHDGMLHWHAGHSIVSFDPFSVDDGDPHPRLSRTVNLPDCLALVTPSGFGVCRGHIQLAYLLRIFDINPIFRVWQLNEGVWHLAHNVLLANSSLKNKFEFVAFHPYHESMIFMRVMHTIYQFNLQTRRSVCNFKLKRGKDTFIQYYKVHPLLHQWFPTPVPSPPSTFDAVCSPFVA